MPLRDHFHSLRKGSTRWEGFHGQWPAMIVTKLNENLPPGYVAEPRVRLGALVEVDVGAREVDALALQTPDELGGVATATWAPPQATLTVAADLPAQYEYEVRVFDTQDGWRLVAAIEIVSPANKDRPEHRRAFVAKCAALLQEQVCVAIVDLVTTRNFNLYSDLLDLIGQTDPALSPKSPTIYGATCRGTQKRQTWLFETWMYPFAIGRPLPTLPLWLGDDLAVPLELEASYEETCRALRIP